MSFYADPAFFILAAVAVIPAIVLGIREKPLFGYALGVSVVFLVLLFMYDVMQGAAFVFFLVLACSLSQWVQRQFAMGKPHAMTLYRVALVATIAPLVIYKVSAVFDGNLLGFLGISYITFKAVQVLIEMRDGLIKDMRIVDYLAFLVFFTPFTSGPIMRSRPFVERAHERLARSDYLSGLARGGVMFLLGAFYKFVLAAICGWAQWFAPEYIGSASALAACGSELAIALFYGLYLFFDFAGYSLMAIGLGAAFGVEVPQNFRAPFRSIDIKDFWNRWHITLSYWLRDFVFMRFSRACVKRKAFKSRLTTACTGYILNMAIMGVWHGITPDYILYGVYHGVLLAICEAYQKKSRFYKVHKNSRGYQVFSWAITMIAVFFGFALFSGQISRIVLGG